MTKMDIFTNRIIHSNLSSDLNCQNYGFNGCELQIMLNGLLLKDVCLHVYIFIMWTYYCLSDIKDNNNIEILH